MTGGNRMSIIIDEIFNTGLVQDSDGKTHRLNFNIDRQEGDFLFQLIKSDSNIKKTLEVGCAYGLSSLHICSALSDRHQANHTIIDPFQAKHYQNIGVLNLQRSGYEFFNLIEEPSEFALPALASVEEGTFDLIFIDGWHTFDHTLVDMFFANRLLKVGGYIVVDDCNMSPVAKAVSYVSNYPAYKLKSQNQPLVKPIRLLAQAVKALIPDSIASFLIPRNLYDKYYVRTKYSNMVALQKVGEDCRTWNWFKSF
jgi:predicted O-methyltransferase YrrM